MSWKQRVRAAIRPVVSPILRRVDGRVDRRVDELSARLDVMRAELDALNRSIPVTLAAAPGGSGDRALRDSLDEVFRRVEFVRREILFELRYGRRPSADVEAEIEGRIVNQTKLDRMGDAIRLNLGAGHVGKADYLNVDARELDGIDVIADIRNLPFEKDSLAEIYSAHMVEHFPLEELRTVLMPYWTSLLRPGGTFVAVVPDMETMIDEYVAGRMSFEELREVTYGAQEYEGDFHFNGYSKASLKALLEEAGLRDVALRAFARRNGMCYEMEIAGVRPAAAG